jgi:spermidine dehydrogenase
MATHDGITRRDFLNGMALAIGAGLAPAQAAAAGATSGADAAYPPARGRLANTGPEVYAAAHALRDGRRYALDRVPPDGVVDLVVVGAGISGLAAAWFWRRRHPRATILLLDAHPDFGGHAMRNEFRVGNRLLVSYGGSESLQSPHTLWSDTAKALLADLKVDVGRFDTAFDRALYADLGLSRGLLFTREAFGVDRLVTGDPMRMVADDTLPQRMNARSIEAFVGDFPLPASARAQIVALYRSARDPLAGRSEPDKEAVLQRTSYRDWLTRVWRLDPKAADAFQGRTLDFFGAGIDGVAARDAFDVGYPGFAGLGLERDPVVVKEMDEPYIHHFPDGNASLARLLVRGLMPGVAPGRTMEDIVGARFDYARLDRPGALARLRLGSTVVALRNRGDGVDVGYVRNGRLRRVRAKHCVYAGYHMMAPRLMPELGAGQAEALAANVKTPFVYVKVAVRNWRAWTERGVHEVGNPMGFYTRMKLDYPVSLGDYRCPRSPDEPMVLHLVHVPTVPGLDGDLRTRWRAGRALLYTTPFATFEDKARDELGRLLGAGFDPERDIAAITVNRWGHGYSYSASTLFDRYADGEEPYNAARARAGRVAFANSDAAWDPYAHAAIDEAWRAVGEL